MFMVDLNKKNKATYSQIVHGHSHYVRTFNMHICIHGGDQWLKSEKGALLNVRYKNYKRFSYTQNFQNVSLHIRNACKEK